MLNNNIKILYRYRTHAVFFALSEHHTHTPDIIAKKLCRRLSHNLKNHTKINRVLLICNRITTHHKLNEKDDLIAWFLIEKKIKKSSNKLLAHNKSSFQFDISQISIQKNTCNLLSFFEKLKNFSSFRDYLRMMNHPDNEKLTVKPHEVLELMPISIPKPWGQEIWFSGIEKRGISNVQTFNSSKTTSKQTIPLSWLIACVPNLFLGKQFAHKDPVLIKILDPFPIPVIGDLYYELHLEKNEVYVVLDVTSTNGRIKLGINEKKFHEYGQNKTHYKNDFLKKILEYEDIRRKIDTLKDNHETISDHLLHSEKSLRDAMDEFCGFVPLQIGDVINVPTYTPHALQHGVKVVEFQTPTYERLIISFAQKVLTQSHWDTKQAFDIMKIEPFKKEPLRILSKTKTIVKELVCEFLDFVVSRYTLNTKNHFNFFSRDSYHIIFNISGKLTILNSPSRILNKSFLSNYTKNICIKQNQCILLPPGRKFSLSSNDNCKFLMCSPIK